MNYLLRVVLIFIISGSAVHAGDKMRLAVIDLEAKGVSKIISVAVSDLIRSDIVETGHFLVIERNQISAILNEQGFQQTGCTDSACAVKMGKLLSANKVLIGEINQIGAAVMITLRIVDVEKGVAEFSSSEKAEDLNALDRTAKKLVTNLTLRITGQAPIDTANRVPAGYYWRGFVPGWGQYYGGSKIKGYIFMGAFAASVLFTGYAYYDWQSKKSEYDGLKEDVPESEFKSKYDSANKAATFVNIGIWAVIGVYVLNWADLLFITDYSPEGASAAIKGEQRYYVKLDNYYNRDFKHDMIYEFCVGMRF